MMADPGELEGDAVSAREQDDVAFRDWAARQSLGFGLVDEHRVRLGEAYQGGARRAMALRAFGSPEAAEA